MQGINAYLLKPLTSICRRRSTDSRRDSQEVPTRLLEVLQTAAAPLLMYLPVPVTKTFTVIKLSGESVQIITARNYASLCDKISSAYKIPRSFIKLCSNDQIINNKNFSELDDKNTITLINNKLGFISKIIAEHLPPLLRDASSYVRPETIKALVEIAKENPGLQEDIIENLTQIIENLSPLLKDRDRYVRLETIKALVEIAKENPRLQEYIIENLTPLLKDSSRDVRLETSKALVEIAKENPGLQEDIIKTLIPLLRDVPPYIILETTKALVEIERENPKLQEDIIKTLTPLLKDRSLYIRLDTIKALVSL